MEKISDAIVLLSPNFIDRIRRYYPQFPINKIFSINNPNTFKKEELTEDIKKENLVIFVGRLVDPEKNIKDFIKMWKIFSNLNPEWRAAIIGDGEKKIFYEKYAKKIGVNNLTFEGQRWDVGEYYRRADFVCLTSMSEGWGMVLTEGMTYGCIPVCFNTYESAKEIIDDGVNGIIAKPLDIMGMARRMDELVKHPELREHMARKAKEKVEQFDLISTVDKWENLLYNLKNENLLY